MLETHLYYLAVVALFGIGLYVLVDDPNLIKKVIGLNLVQISVYLFFVTAAYVEGAAPPLADLAAPHANPLPHAIVLTAIVVGVSITALGLAIVIRLHEEFGTIDAREIESALSDEK